MSLFISVNMLPIYIYIYIGWNVLQLADWFQAISASFPSIGFPRGTDTAHPTF